MSSTATDLERGGDQIAKDSARKAAGRDRSDATASDFDSGWRAGRDASDPEKNTSTRDVVQRTRDEYGPRDEEQRAAYRDGYAAGANRNR